MKKKMIKTIILLLLVGILILAIAMWLMSALGTSPKIPPIIVLRIQCKTVKGYLLNYYNDVGNKIPADMVLGFVTYVTDPEKKLKFFSRKAPIEPYTSHRDVGFYLLLPENLESAMPVLIGYTTPVTTKTGEVYRGTFFLRGKEITILTLEEHTLKDIVGSEQFENKEPDLYIWELRSKYLRRQSDKEN